MGAEAGDGGKGLSQRLRRLSLRAPGRHTVDAPLHLYPEGSFLYQFCFTALIPRFLACCTDLHVSGREHIPRSGPLIVISNHVDNLDTYVVGSQVPAVINFLARSDGLHSRWLGLYWRQMAALPADREGFSLALARLRAGGIIGVFPEGVIAPALVQAKPGIGLLALRSGAPVLPCAVWGTERVLRGPHDLVRRPPVYLRIGPPRRISRSRRHSQELADLLMTDVAALLPPRYRGFYSDRVGG